MPNSLSAMLLVSGLLLGALPATAVHAAEAGKALFDQRCAACHQAAGVGAPGLAPPLVDAALWQGLGKRAQEYFFTVLNSGLSGTIEVDGVGYYGLVMPTQADLSAEQMGQLMNYVLNDLNQTGTTLDAGVLEQARANPLSHTDVRAIRKDVH
ncbi:cytochrome c [Pokkaliibacter sp. MBI-7]|uniref:c-type cytochrome n=1 Tax=Pokkaliibacter sp. MBI-7 TaxID=3040600 RepID=UPI00244B694A|nr:cytochrome c [Pokkaliibacter sp. MBI-7]MDH2432346.1 cytochrome c [Pokkaliibacter sp. MBI-7]